MERLIEELQDLIKEVPDKTLINKMINKLGAINSLYNELDYNLKEYESIIKEKDNKISNYKKEEIRLKRVIIDSLDLNYNFNRYDV